MNNRILGDVIYAKIDHRATIQLINSNFPGVEARFKRFIANNSHQIIILVDMRYRLAIIRNLNSILDVALIHLLLIPNPK